MVEIFTLGRFADRISQMAQARGYRPEQYRLMAVILWCIGEIAGVFMGLRLVSQDSPLSLLAVYITALCGAAIGALIAYGIVRK